jgi:NADH-quinone oxidoreductase subunit M
MTHLKVSQEDVYQVSRKQDRFVVVTFSSILVVLLCVLFFTLLRVSQGVSTFTQVAAVGQQLPAYLKVLSSIFMMSALGAFPLHFWVKPLFSAPARYGLAVITRLNVGFIVWCKLYPLIFSGNPFLESLLTYGCAANLLYAAFLLFGERRLSQIVSSLYLFHVPLLILAVKITGQGGVPDFALDFANITVAISGLLVILGMLRDRLGAEELDRASGLGISYPFLGISFLVCVLSLVGFPGTLGFISSEVMLHHFAESTWPVAACFIITLAFNGYSSFRIFGESFYGDPAKSFRKVFQPLAREKIAIALVLLFLFASGIGPQIVGGH